MTTIPEKHSFDVFISYASADKPPVRRLAQELAARGLHVWHDEWELPPGRPWQEAMEQIMKEAGAVAVVAGPSGLEPWTDTETRESLRQAVNRRLPVIPVLLPGTQQQPELPIFLEGHPWVDFRHGFNDEGLKRLELGITGGDMGRNSSISPSAPTVNRTETLQLWRNKIDLLAEQEASVTDPAKKFALSKLIEQAQAEIREVSSALGVSKTFPQRER